jgi:hypothetical protein
MPRSEIPEAVRRLIVESIDSVPELETILLLRKHADRAWSIDETGARLYVSTTVATHVLAVLSHRGFLVADGDGYRYSPATPELETTVTALATAYAANLIDVTHMIHRKPSPSVLQFADAFRLRKDP